MTGIERLFVIWRAPPGDGTRHVVGELGGKDPFWFRYSPDLEQAFKAGFPGFPEFPLTKADSIYKSSHLFATFRQRIPSSRRPDFSRLMTAWGIEDPHAPQLEILARSGGFLLTDRIELAEYRAADDELGTPLRIRVAGQKYYQDPDAQLALDVVVRFRREPDNKHDSQAVEVLSHNSKLGYVPRQYSAIFARLLDAGAPLVGKTERRLLVPGEARRWVIRTWNRLYDHCATVDESSNPGNQSSDFHGR